MMYPDYSPNQQFNGFVDNSSVTPNALNTFNIRKGIRRSVYLTRKPVSRNREDISAYRKEMTTRFSLAQNAHKGVKLSPVLSLFKSMSNDVVNNLSPATKLAKSKLKIGSSEPSLFKNVPSYPLIGKMEENKQDVTVSEVIAKVLLEGLIYLVFFIIDMIIWKQTYCPL